MKSQLEEKDKRIAELEGGLSNVNELLKKRFEWARDRLLERDAKLKPSDFNTIRRINE